MLVYIATVSFPDLWLKVVVSLKKKVIMKILKRGGGFFLDFTMGNGRGGESIYGHKFNE
jgi:hypothetical protein